MISGFQPAIVENLFGFFTSAMQLFLRKEVIIDRKSSYFGTRGNFLIPEQE
jgi:hypothetical protein